MEITYIGHACFKIKGKATSLVVDPYDPEKLGMKLPKLEAEIVLVTHDHYDHNFIPGVKNYRLTIDSPGEYETNDVTIQGISVFHDSKEGAERGKNTMYLIEIDGFTVLHTGDLGHKLSKDTLEKIPSVDVLMLPVGGTYTIDDEVATDVISDIEPGIVVPMHYSDPANKLASELAPLEKFLDEMGVKEKAIKEEKLKVASRSDVPEETAVVVLDPQH
jgi:L-ascorbate metabolism protein UlaG (beta-lactamase superfamily)